MKTFRGRLPLLLALVLMLLAGACGGDDEVETTADDNGSQQGTQATAGDAGCKGKSGTVKVGYVGTLSGAASFLGQAPLDGAQLAVERLKGDEEFRGLTFQIVSEDDGLDPAKGVAAAQKLINQDKVNVIIGAAHSGVSQAMVGATQQAGIPQISPLSALNALTDPVKPTFFRLWNKDAVIAATLAEFATERFQKVGLLYETTAFGQGGKDALTAAFEKQNSKLVGAEAFDLNAQDLTPQLSKLRSAGAEAIIVQSQGPQAALTARNLQQLGYNAKILGHPGLAQQGFPTLAKGAAEGAIVIDGLDREKPATKEFIEAYKAKHGSEPFSFYPATGYDAVHLIAQGLESAGCDPAKLRDGLENVESFKGVVGRAEATIGFSSDDHDGYGKEALIFKEIRNGQLVPFQG